MYYVVVKVLGVVVAVAGTPYNQTECEKSLEVLGKAPEIQAEYYCTQNPPQVGKLNPQQQAQLEAWEAQQETP